MKDERYVFISDVKERNNIARSARDALEAAAKLLGDENLVIHIKWESRDKTSDHPFFRY